MVILLSGGVDSLVCAEMSRHAGDLAGCVFVDYGHPAQIPEGWKAFAYCGARGVTLRVVHAFGLALGDMETREGARVVPARNAVLLSLAANVAHAMGAGALVIGCNRADFDAYPDCRRAFLDRMEDALGLSIITPLMDASKSDVIGLARRYGLSPSDAWSCYGPGPTPCRICPSCREAESAWSAP